ncbi:MAG: hypothetical protein PHG02_06945 [Oscillospiraceae bacterium]|nr:hypothetical protein [Oscillospiraceae bacterium]
MSYIIIMILLIAVFVGVQISSFRRSLIKRKHKVDNAMAQIGLQLDLQWEILDMLQRELLVKAGKAITLFDYDNRKKITEKVAPQEIIWQCKYIKEGFQLFEYIQKQTPQLQTDEVCCQAVQAFKQYNQMIEISRMIYNNAVTKTSKKWGRQPLKTIAKWMGFVYREPLEKLPQIL